MIGKSMQDAINEQINKEFFSAYLKLYDFVLDRGGRVQLKTIDGPATEWKSNLEVAEQVAEHEGKVTASIHDLYELALKEKDYAAQVMLQWFIGEQVEEEKNAAELVAKLKLIEERGTAVLMLDHRLEKRGNSEGEEE